MSYNLVDPTTGDLTRVAGGTLYADLPIGSWIKNDMGTLPSGFLKEGDVISQSEYPELYAKYGSTVPYKADTSELSDYSTPITFEQITTGYTMPYDGVLNIGANSNASSVIANVTVNGELIVNIGTTSYTSTFVRFRKGDVIKVNNIVSNNYVLKVAYYKKSLIVKAMSASLPFDFTEYVRNQNLLSDLENITISTNSSSPSIMEYDGFLMCYNGDGGYIYINGVGFILGQVQPSGVYNVENTNTIPVKKGDSVYTDVTPTRLIARFYKQRDYGGR